MVIDWGRPIEAVPSPKGVAKGVKPIPAAVDRSYGLAAGRTPVRLDRNLWVTRGPSGTWYFGDDGEAIAGRNQNGKQDGLWLIRNKVGE